MSEITFAEVVHAAEVGAPKARDQLFVLLYDALRQMAQRELRRGGGVSLTPTTLLHETYLNISQRESVAFSDRGQFMSYAARAMRGLIVDYLRSAAVPATFFAGGGKLLDDDSVLPCGATLRRHARLEVAKNRR
jgi:DNA-directed RNA polymerase specialized sigma24 family protein